jgi:7-carboxy-7-deazaguanine synthase
MSTAAPVRAAEAVSGASTLRITEVFLSLQGETSRVGLPTVFVRLTGCPLRCVYCDTAYAFSGGEVRSLQAVLDEVGGFGVRHVTVTGGEPLAQPGCLALLSALCDAGHDVSLETSGALDISGIDARVARIVDVKAPGSGEAGRNRWQDLRLLGARDEVKFVLCDRADYEWARLQLDLHPELRNAGGILFSPVHARLDARALADWIVEDRLRVRLQLQLHKLLWGDEPGR